MHSSAGIESLICGVQRGPQYYAGLRTGLALQLLFLRASESMGNHDSNVVGAGRVG